MRLHYNPLLGIASLLIITLSSCEDDPIPLAPNPDPVEYVRLDDELIFITMPKSDSVVNFQFDRIHGYQFKTIFLMAGEDTLNHADFTTSEYNSQEKLAASVSHQFDRAKDYFFLVEAVDYYNPNTRYTFQLPTYRHVFAEAFTFQPFAEFYLWQDYDFSPSRDIMFVSDFIGNKYNIHRVDLKNHSTETLFIENELYGRIIRAASDHEFIYVESYDTFNPHISPLKKMDIRTKESIPMGSYSRGYGSISRIIDNKLIVNDRTSTIAFKKSIDVNSGEATELGEIEGQIFENNFDQLIIGNYFVEPNDLSLSPLPEADKDAYFLYKDENGYTFYMEKLPFPRGVEIQYPRTYVYKDEQLIFESKESDIGHRHLFRKFNVSDGKFIYYKSHLPDSTYRIDGLYSVDLSSGEETLIHADYSPYYLAVYDFGDKGIITQRGWEFGFMEKIQP